MNKNEIYEAIRDSELVSDDIAGDIAEHLCLTFNSAQPKEKLCPIHKRKGCYCDPRPEFFDEPKDTEVEKLKQRNTKLEAEAELGNIPYKEAIELKERVAELEKALEKIEYYWNKNENYNAMNDALWYIIKIAEQALSKNKVNIPRG